MSTAPLHRTRTGIEWLALLVAAFCACGVAQAKQSDKDQPININASSFAGTQDNGTLVHGQGATIDYKVSENTVILTGNAVVVQQGKGEFHGEKLVYNTDTGEIQGSPVTGGRVHITLQPRTKPAPAKPVGTAPNAPASAPAGASSSAPASAPTPAPASTSGTH